MPLVLPVDQTTAEGDLLEFATPAGTPLVGDNAAAVTGYPAASRRVRSLTAQLSIHTDIDGTYVWALASNPTDITEPVDGTTSPGASGTWSGASGSEQTWSGNLKGWKIPDWGEWEADYLTFDTQSSRSVYYTGAAAAGWTAWPLDIQFRARRSDWDDGTGTLLTMDGVWNQIYRSTTGLTVRWQWSGTQDRTASWATLGVTDGEWSWIRITADDTNGLRWWTSADGSSWSVAHTLSSITGLESMIGTTASPRIGSGTALGGWDGDISDMTLGELGGSQRWSLNREAIESASDTSWDSDGGPANWVISTTPPAITGTVRGTETITFTPEDPFPVGDVRFIFGANDEGRITIDTLTFDVGNQPGWKVGTL